MVSFLLLFFLKKKKKFQYMATNSLLWQSKSSITILVFDRTVLREDVQQITLINL